METNQIYLSVIIPAYNEEGRIEKTLRRLDEYLRVQTYTYEILVVVNNSTDSTEDVVRQLTSSVAHLRLISIAHNVYKGGAVMRGMQEGVGSVRLFTDADNSTDISHFEKMKPLFDEGQDVVITSRHPWDAAGAGQEISQPFYKRVMGIAGNIFIQIMVVPGIWDTQNGFKAFSARAAETIFSQLTIMGWGFDIEALALVRKYNFKLGIVPAHWMNDTDSHVRLKSYLEVLWETIRVRWNLWTGVYTKRINT